MAIGATDHQKDHEKNNAPSYVYSSDSLCKSCCVVRNVHGGIPSCQNPETEGNQGSKRQRRQVLEHKARDVLGNNPKIDTLKQFLRQVPWDIYQPSPSHDRSIVDKAGEEQPSAYASFGMYARGGMWGLTVLTQECPWMCRVLNAVVQHYSPHMTWTSLTISLNSQAEPHKDRFNLVGSQNIVIPLEKPSSGGEVWVEADQAQTQAPTCELSCENQLRVGELKPLNGPIQFDPKKHHATMPWTGNRLVLIGYTHGCFRKLSKGQLHALKSRGFQVPWKRNIRPAQLRLSAPIGVGQALSTTDFEKHARQQQLDVQKGDAGAVSSSWRDSTLRLDEDPAQVPLGGACGRPGGCDDRAGGIQDDQPLQDQGHAPGEDGRVPADLHGQDELRPSPQCSTQIPDGDPGSPARRELHGLREAQWVDIRRNSHSCSLLQCLDSGDSHQRTGVPRTFPKGQGAAGECDTRPTEQEGEGHASRRSQQPGDLLYWGNQQCDRLGDRAGCRGVTGGSPSGTRARAQEDPRGHEQSQHRHSDGKEQGEPQDNPVSSDTEPSDLQDRVDGDHMQPGVQCQLPFSVAKQIGSSYEQATVASVQELCSSKVVVLEVGGCEDSGLGAECEKLFGKGSSLWLSDWNGGDLESLKGQEYVLRTIEEVQPQCVWFRPDTSPFSPFQVMNQKTPEQAERLQAKQAKATLQYKGFANVIRASAMLGVTCVLEMSDVCDVWQQSWVQELQESLDFYRGTCQGCQVNLRSFQGALVCRGWGLVSNDGALVQNMSLGCDGKHARPKGPENRQTCKKGYTREFSRRVLRYLERQSSWFEMARDFQGLGNVCHVAGEVDQPEEGAEPNAGIEDIPADKRRQIFQHLRRIHSATGHCSKKYLRGSLKRRGASKEVLRCVDHFSCDVCDELSRPDPRSQATLTEIPPKWHTLQCDAFSWNHPQSGEKWQCMLGIDEGCRFRVGRVLFQHASRTPSAQDFIGYFEGNWMPSFGKPQVLRLDPAGCFRSKALDQYLAERQVEVQHIPAEAHWQISLAERSIQTMKHMMTALVSEFPHMSTSEAFARSVWASNNRDQYLGYSPLQHAFGRAPNELGQLGESMMRDVPVLTENGVSAEFGVDVKAMLAAEKAFLEAQAKERLRRAELSGRRGMQQFCPGDLVYAWRRMTPRSDGNRHFKGGQFVGPYRVLATETRVDGAGEMRASHVIWLYRGGQLVKASPQQLRPATAREESWSELQDPTPIPWTITDTLRKQPPHQFEDVTADAEHMPPVEDLEREEEERELERRERTPRRRTGKQPPETPARASHPTPSQSSKRGRSWSDHRRGEETEEVPQPVRPVLREHRSRSNPLRGDARSSEDPRGTVSFLEGCGVVFPEEGSKFWETDRPAVSFSMDLPQVQTKQGKEWVRDMGCFFVKQLRRQTVEISERQLTARELEGFRAAKSKEVKNFIVAKAFQALPSHLKPNRSQILKMRWLLTWKLDDKAGDTEPLKRDASGNPLKPKARAIVLGYMDPEYEYRPTSSPTMTRSTRQLFLQNCANHNFKVEKGDISGAFLQGDDFGVERPMVCEPLPEICEALGVPTHSPMLLTKAAYGLVEAPIQWFLSISRFLESIGAERQLSDPCCWGFFRADRTPIGWVCGHVDDFMFGGRCDDPEWIGIRNQIRSRFKWGQWESGRFLQCGVLIEQQESSFLLSQPEYLDSVSEIHINRARWNEPAAPVTPHELYQLRSVLGALSWHANQVAPQWSAAVGMLLSKTCKGSVQEIIDANKLLRKAKMGQHQKLRIHGFGSAKPVLAAWADAADSHRPDGGSTKGILVGWTDQALLDGDLTKISPLFWQSAKIQRTCRSSGAAETHAAIDAEDELFSLRFQVYEFLGGQVSVWRCNDAVMDVDGVLISDSTNLYDRLHQTVLTLKGAEKRTDIESLCLKESMEATGLKVRWVNGDSQLANSLTKAQEPHQLLEFFRRGGCWRIVHDPELTSGRKRRQLGLGSLETKQSGS